MESLLEAASLKAVRLIVLSFLLSTALVAALAPPSVSAGQPVRYQPPLERPVIDAFRRPVNPFAAGNRGLEYGSRPGDAIDSIGDGVVSFAGQVGGARYVTITHPDGLRSSYSYLGRVEVVVGQSIRAGQRVGIAGVRPFHLGVRRDRIYLDPARLFGAPPGHTHAILVGPHSVRPVGSRIAPR